MPMRRYNLLLLWIPSVRGATGVVWCAVMDPAELCRLLCRLGRLLGRSGPADSGIESMEARQIVHPTSDTCSCGELTTFMVG